MLSVRALGGVARRPAARRAHRRVRHRLQRRLVDRVDVSACVAHRAVSGAHAVLVPTVLRAAVAPCLVQLQPTTLPVSVHAVVRAAAVRSIHTGRRVEMLRRVRRVVSHGHAAALAAAARRRRRRPPSTAPTAGARPAIAAFAAARLTGGQVAVLQEVLAVGLLAVRSMRALRPRRRAAVQPATAATSGRRLGKSVVPVGVRRQCAAVEVAEQVLHGVTCSSALVCHRHCLRLLFLA